MRERAAGGDTRTPEQPTSQREQLVEQIVHGLATGRGSLVLGDAGVGKTYLAARALQAGGHEHHGPGTTTSVLGTAPAAPFAGLARLLGLPDRPMTDAEAEAATRRVTLVDHSRRPAVLAIDDAHLLDRSSAEVVARLARRGELLLVVTARPVAGSASPWYELWRDDVLNRLDVPELSLTEAEAMLTALLGGAVSAETTQVLWKETGGNAFHLHELVTDHREAGTVRARAGIWRLTGTVAPAPRQRPRVRRDLDGLSADALQTLRTLALLGPVRLSSVLDESGHHLVRELLDRGLVRTTSPRAHPEVLVDLPHRLLSQVVRADTPRPARRTILERAVMLRGGPPLQPHTVLLALEEDVTISAEAVRATVADATTHGRARDVLAIVDAALAARAPVTLSEVDTLTLLVERAFAHQALRHRDAALADLDTVLPRLLHHARSEPEDDQVPGLVVSVTTLRAGIVHEAEHGIDAALDALADGASWLATLPPRPQRPHRERDLDVARLVLLGYAGRHREAQAEAVRLLEDGHDAHHLLPLVCPTGLGLLQAGRFKDAERVVRRYRPVAAAHHESDPSSSGDLAVVAFFARLWSGEIADLDSPPSSALDAASWAGGAHLGRGLVAAAHGAWSPARRDLHAANARSSLAGNAGPVATGFGRAAEALAAAACGEDNDARALLTEIDEQPAGRSAALTGEIRLLTLDTLVWLRDPAAPTTARALADWAHAQQLARIELEARHRILVLDRWRDRPAEPAALRRIEELRPRVRSARAAALAQHAYALRRDDADLLEIAERELSRRGLWLPPGRQALALTHREREIAALARARLTSRTIAARLGVSARTVDSHLASAFTKLGVSSREDLSHALT